MASENYFVRLRGKISGPFDFAGLQRLVKLGMLSRIHEVSKDKIDWSPATAVPGLLPEVAPRATVLPEPRAAAVQEGPYAVKESADSNEVTAPALSNSQSQPLNGPMIACASCGSVLPAAQLFDDRGRYICRSCYQRLAPSMPPHERSPANGDGSTSYHGYGVASLVLGIGSLVLPFIGVICSILAIVFGSVALRGNRRVGSREGNGMARAGNIMGIIALSLYGVWFIILVAAAVASTHGH